MALCSVFSSNSFMPKNIPSFTANNLALRIIVSHIKHSHRMLGDKVARQPLNRQSDDLLTLAYRFFLGFFFDDTNPLCRLVFGLFDHLIDQIFFRFFPCHARDLLKLPSRFVDLPVTFSRFVLDIFLPRFQRLLSPHQLAFAFVNGLRSFIETFFSADQPLLEILEFAADFSYLLFKLCPLFKHTVFSLELSLFLDGCSVFLRLLYDSGCGGFGAFCLRACLFAANPNNCACKKNSANQSGNSKQQTLIQ